MEKFPEPICIPDKTQVSPFQCSTDQDNRQPRILNTKNEICMPIQDDQESATMRNFKEKLSKNQMVDIEVT